MPQLGLTPSRSVELALVVLELKDLVAHVGFSQPRSALRVLWADQGAKPFLEVRCAEESRESPGAEIQIYNPAARFEWGSLRSLVRDSDELPVGPAGGVELIWISGHTPCRFVRRWLSCDPEPLFTELRDLLCFDGLDRRAMLLDPEQVAEADRDLCAAMVVARLQARSAALEAGGIDPSLQRLFLIPFGVALHEEQEPWELLGGAYLVDCREGICSTRFLGVGDDPSRYQVGGDGMRPTLRDEGAEVVREAHDHRMRIARLQEQMDWPDLSSDQRVLGVGGAVGIKLRLRVLAQTAPIQTVMRLLGAGFVDIRQMVWFSSGTASASLARRAREVLLEVERQVDRLNSAEHDRLLGTLGIAGVQAPSTGTSA